MAEKRFCSRRRISDITSIMMREGILRRRAGIAVLALVLVLLLPQAAMAHAVLMRSTPAQRGSVKAGDVDIRLTFNSRIDASRSTLSLVGPDGKSQALTLAAGAGANVLATKAAGAKPGDYKLQWQVLASDGHITRGVLEFRVL